MMRYLLLALFLFGCTHTRIVSEQDQGDLTILRQRAKTKRLLIELDNGEKYQGVLISGAPDSLRWLDAKTGKYEARSVEELARVTVPAGYTTSLALVGVTILAAVFTDLKEPECQTDSCTIESLSFAYAKIGRNVGFGLLGILGFAIGQAVEPAERFVFKDEPHQQKTPPGN